MADLHSPYQVLLVPPVQPIVPQTPSVPPVVPQLPLAPPVIPQAADATLNWSYFMPDFYAKPDEDSEDQFSRTDYWMTNHAFPDNVKFKRFCLTPGAEARLFYEAVRP